MEALSPSFAAANGSRQRKLAETGKTEPSRTLTRRGYEAPGAGSRQRELADGAKASGVRGFTTAATKTSAPATANAPSIALPLAFVLTGIVTLLVGTVWLAFRPETLSTYHYNQYVIALTHLTKLFLPKMMQRKSGRIMNISSVAGWAPMPLWSVYAATKAYVLSFSEALARDVRGSGVKVTCFCPTVTQTLFFKRSNSENCTAYKRRVLLMDSETAAKQGYRALVKGKTCVIAGLASSMMVFFLGRFAPRGLGIRLSQTLSAPT